MNTKLVKIFALVIIILFIGLLGGAVQWFRVLHTPILTPGNSPVEFVVQPGVSVKEVAAALHDQGVLAKPAAFVWLARIKLQTKKLQAGEYRIDPGTTPAQLLNKLVTGKVVLYSFTIIPGWTFTQLLDTLEHDPHLNHSLQNLTAAEIMQRLGHAGENPEGRFAPDTYKFHTGFNDIEVLQQAYDHMRDKLQQLWQQRDPNVPYADSYAALIAASMIEKEASLSEERTIIAGVIIRRLQKHMYLQLDPTVIYGLGPKFDGDLTIKDLRKNTLYNTYVHKGLPPTPICMPSAASIDAALHPAAGDVLYFVAKGDGSHIFSATLKEHNAAVRKYQIDKKQEQ